jgi:hypothetical protein
VGQKGFKPAPRNARKAAETKIPLKKKTAENLQLLSQQSDAALLAARNAQRELLNAATVVLNEHDIEEAELVRITAPTKDEGAQLVVIVKKKSKG